MSSRVIKIRSLENAIYTPDYNRMRFQVSPDEMSTDLSESYLAFKMYIVNGLTNEPFTQEEILKLDKSHVMFALGDNQGESYSSAAMIKTARLFSMSGEMTLLEEINYSNVLSQYLHQVANDFETLASESLLTMGSTGMLLGGSASASLGSYFGAELSLNDPAIQINIKLSDLFGMCRSNNFWLSMTNGLMIELELEPTKPLIQQQVGIDLTTPLPKELSNGLGFTEDYTTNSKSIRAPGQNIYSSSAQEFASSSTLVEKPEYYYYDAKKYVESMIGGADVDTAALIVGADYQIKALGTITEQQWATAGAVASPDGPDVDTAALKVGVSYKIKTLGPLDVLQWNTAGATTNAGDAIDSDAFVVDSFYTITSLGGMVQAEWVTAGVPATTTAVVGTAFKCLAQVTPAAGAKGVCSTLSLPSVGDVFTALAVTTTGGTCVVPGGQFVGQEFKCIAQTTTGGTCVTLNSQGEIISSPGQSSRVIEMLPTILWTTADMDSLGMAVGRGINLVFKIKQSQKVDRFFKHTSIITQQTAHTGTSGPQIQIDDTFVYPIFTGTSLQGATIELDHFEVKPIDSLGTYPNVQYKYPIADFEGLINTSTLKMLNTEVVTLQSAGILSAGTTAMVTNGAITSLSGGSTLFTLGVNMDAGNVTAILPDVYETPDISTLRKLYSNQTKQLPTQNGLCRCLGAVRDGNDWIVSFQNLGLKNDNSIQRSIMAPPGGVGAVTAGLGVITPATNFYLKFGSAKVPAPQRVDQMVVGEWYGVLVVGDVSQAEWTTSGNTSTAVAVGDSFKCIAPGPSGKNAVVSWEQPNKTDPAYQPKSWQVTKAELVLVQNMKDSSMPPSTIYPTMKCEAVTIENGVLSEYQRQFIVSEPNCYSVLLLTPEYSGAGESLISHSRNIEQYRWSVQNIDNTNRNIILKNNSTNYPSTLHLDKFVDCMKNDVTPVKSFSGINGVARSVDAPVCFPLKIYTASDAESSYLNPLSGYTLQFAGFSDPAHEKYITPGAIMLFKFCYKTL